MSGPFDQTGQSAVPGVRAIAYVDGTGRRQKGASVWDRQRRDYRRAYRYRRQQNARVLGETERQAREDAASRLAELDRGYQGTQRQLYRDYMERQRTLPQQMAAQGYTGGLTESSRLRLESGYGEALNTGEQERLDQRDRVTRDLSRQLLEARTAAAAADSQARQDYAGQLARLREQKRSSLEQRAAVLAAQGDFSLYGKLGYSDREIRYLKKMFRRRNPELF